MIANNTGSVPNPRPNPRQSAPEFHTRQLLDQKIAITDQQTDALVYELYELTDRGNWDSGGNKMSSTSANDRFLERT